MRRTFPIKRRPAQIILPNEKGLKKVIKIIEEIIANSLKIS